MIAADALFSVASIGWSNTTSAFPRKGGNLAADRIQRPNRTSPVKSFSDDRIAAYARGVDADWATAGRAQVEDFRRRHRIGLLTLLFTDIIGSTQLKQTLGDAQAITLIQRHHSALRAVLGQFSEGEEIGTAGDSFFIVFAKPSDAVKYSLQVEAKLRALTRETGATMFDRIGIHVGEVFIDEAPSGGARETCSVCRLIPAPASCRSAPRTKFWRHGLLLTARARF
jgi:class 3 adenylate cyclase